MRKTTSAATSASVPAEHNLVEPDMTQGIDGHDPSIFSTTVSASGTVQGVLNDNGNTGTAFLNRAGTVNLCEYRSRLAGTLPFRSSPLCWRRRLVAL